jgi:hypothetical protein
MAWPAWFIAVDRERRFQVTAHRAWILQPNRHRHRGKITPPRATYRLQFHHDFTFRDAAALVPYLSNSRIHRGAA